MILYSFVVDTWRRTKEEDTIVVVIKKKKKIAKIEDERSFLSFVKYKGKNNRGPLIFILTLY